ncbi:MAG: hypothetical protein QOF64_2424, partial [Candidatus Binatota bacterium]|nr:hypothetical protein [Candidatus Binatota bacterium]
MKRSRAILVTLISAAICLGCSTIPGHRFIGSPREIDGGKAYQGIDNSLAATQPSRIWFEDHTREIVGDALTMIKRNERDGASLDQRWYAFRRFGENLEHILRAREVRFYGGREADIRLALAGEYRSMIPFEANQDPGEIRLFTAHRDRDGFDLVIIGQNGREVALKTVIRLVYLFKFSDEEI